MNLTLIFHPSTAPPHLSKDGIDLMRWNFKLISVWTQIESLLPPPYMTKCFDYSQKESEHKSREDRIVKYMQKFELISVDAMKSGCMDI